MEKGKLDALQKKAAIHSPTDTKLESIRIKSIRWDLFSSDELRDSSRFQTLTMVMCQVELKRMKKKTCDPILNGSKKNH